MQMQMFSNQKLNRGHISVIAAECQERRNLRHSMFAMCVLLNFFASNFHSKFYCADCG